MFTFPSLWLLLPLVSLAYGLLIAQIVQHFSRRHPGVQGLDRKLFHIGIFTGAVPCQLFLGFWGIVIYGSTIGLLVLVAFRNGESSPLYRTMRRRDDGGEKERLVLIPLGATALGGLIGVLLVGNFAIVGYLTCGWGDAAGELVGKNRGRRPYSPPFSLGRTPTRSVEGSLAVLVLGFLGAWAGLALLGYPLLQSMGVGFACALTGVGGEAVSGKGTDNFWVQLLPALTAWWLLG
jgi:dolichol kinase